VTLSTDELDALEDNVAAMRDNYGPATLKRQRVWTSNFIGAFCLPAAIRRC
jgi:hypothetical protein